MSEIISGFALVVFFFGFSFFLLAIGQNPVSGGVLLFASSACVCLAFTLYGIFAAKRVEFYEDYL